jgi:hypothetical protein
VAGEVAGWIDAIRNASEPVASTRNGAGYRRCEYQWARLTVTIAPAKKRISPAAAAIPSNGTPIPISNPAAPAALRAPRVDSQERGTPYLSMLLTTHSERLKSTIAA